MESFAVSRAFKKPARRAVILACIALLVVLLVVGGILIARSVLTGGAASPKEAVNSLVASISNKDLAGVYAMIAPREREVFQRIQGGAIARFEQLGIADAVKATSTRDASIKDASMGISLDGIAVRITGVRPRVKMLSGDLAAIVVNTGKFEWSVDPSKTTGLVRSRLDALAVTKRLSGSMAFADLRGGRGLTLMVAEKDSRWYVSSLLSWLDFIDTGVKGVIPTHQAKGANSRQAAVEAAVRAFPKVAKDGVAALAPYLEGEEAEAAYLYGASTPGLGDLAASIDVRVNTAKFKPGPEEGDRGVAFVDHLGLSFRGDPITLTSRCITTGKESKVCLNGSGYFRAAGGKGSLSILSDHGKFALTAVKERGSWKLSLLDTVADHAVAWMDSLTRAQWLATLGLQSGDKVVGTLTAGKEGTVTFNSAGYSVMKLVVPSRMRLEVSGDTSGTVYDTSGHYVTDLIPGYASHEELRAGNYKVVLIAGKRWADAFSDQGNKLRYSTDFKIEEFAVKPPTIDGDAGPKSEVLKPYVGGVEATLIVQVPDGNDVDLVLRVTEVAGDGVGDGLIAIVDEDQDGVGVAAVPGANVVVPLPADSESHLVGVWLPASQGVGHIGFTLSFEPKQGMQRPANFLVTRTSAG